MKRLVLFIALAALAGAHPARAQSAESIIQKHIKALGGEKALKAITAVAYRGRVASPAAAEGRFRLEMKRPDRVYLEIQRETGTLIEASNGKTAWREGPSDGVHTLTGKDQSRARATAVFWNDHFLSYKKEKSKVRLQGRETLNGRPVFVLVLTTRLGIERTLYFDAENFLLLKESVVTEGVPEETLYADYRKVDGVLEPHRITLRRGAETIPLEVDEIAHQRPPDDRLFDFPAHAGAPLPDIPSLLAAVEKNQKTIDKIIEDYTYDLLETRFEIDSKGNLKTKSSETYQVFRIEGLQIRKLVARNGQPLSAEEQKKEDQRIEKRIREFKEAKEKREKAKQRTSARESKSGEQSNDENDDVGISDFLRTMQLVNPRRERFRGQDVIVFEFEPRPGYKPRNRGEALIQKLSGAVWVDEQARQVARLEARMLDNYRMGGGLVASLHKGSAFVFEQELVNNEVWLPRYAEVNASVRVFLVAGMKFNVVNHYSNYKKFQVDTRIMVAPPKTPE
ncbi:MAG TPA: hypothetical protein VNL38_00755 [Candidatus Nitrosotenuis sp.]|nr:hypothetical protein [Candidatus Nitrosotenuis sp.]